MTETAAPEKLVASLAAGLDEDEATAKAAAVCDLVQQEGYEPGDWSWLRSYGQPQPNQMPLIDHQSRFDPARELRQVTAHRDLIAAILGQPHRQVDDGWYSCAQAADDDEPEPGSACLDEDRAGGPCDCGRDARVERLLRIMAGIYEGESRP